MPPAELPAIPEGYIGVTLCLCLAFDPAATDDAKATVLEELTANGHAAIAAAIALLSERGGLSARPVTIH